MQMRSMEQLQQARLLQCQQQVQHAFQQQVRHGADIHVGVGLLKERSSIIYHTSSADHRLTWQQWPRRHCRRGNRQASTLHTAYTVAIHVCPLSEWWGPLDVQGVKVLEKKIEEAEKKEKHADKVMKVRGHMYIPSDQHASEASGREG